MQTEASRHKESSRGVHTHSLLVCVCVWYVLHTYTYTYVHTHKGNSNWSLPFGRRFLGACDVQLQRLLRLTHAHTHPCRVKSSVCVCVCVLGGCRCSQPLVAGYKKPQQSDSACIRLNVTVSATTDCSVVVVI